MNLNMPIRFTRSNEDQRSPDCHGFWSPYLSHIDHLGGHLKTEKAEHSLTSQEALCHFVKSCSDNMTHQVLDKLVESEIHQHSIIKVYSNC